MAAHVGEIIPVAITSTGTILAPGTSFTLGDKMKSSTEHRVKADHLTGTSDNYCTIKRYIELEGNSGYKIRFMNQTYIVSDNLA